MPPDFESGGREFESLRARQFRDFPCESHGIRTAPPSAIRWKIRPFLELLSDEWRALDRYYDELLHRLPLPSRRRRRFLSLGPYPWEFGGFGASLPTLDEAHLARISQVLEPDERLHVRRVSYASPGSIDLVSIGVVVGHIKDFMIKLIERHDSKRHRELSDEREELDNDRLRLENARTFVALARDLGYTEVEVRRLVAHVDDKQQFLVQVIDDDKLRGVSDLNLSKPD
jgi:hypothetical protein